MILYALSLTLFSNYIAWWYGFYKFPNGIAAFRSPPGWIKVACIFLFFLLLQLILIPLIAYGVMSYSNGTINTSLKVSEEQQTWINISSIFFTPLLLWGCSYLFDAAFTRSLVGLDNKKKSFLQNLNDFFIGAKTWLVAFPAAMLLGQLMENLVKSLFNPPDVDQVAVQMFKNSFENAWQYKLTFLGLIFAVPLAEELLFRGYFQQWLKQKMPVAWAIVLTSLLFAFFHFSPVHGWHNLELIPALFLLSCFLGFIVERQHSLWASIGLHATFNFVSVSMITFQMENVTA